jgi:hypothetical protein
VFALNIRKIKIVLNIIHLAFIPQKLLNMSFTVNKVILFYMISERVGERGRERERESLKERKTERELYLLENEKFAS